MKADVNRSRQAHAHDHQHTGFTPPGAAPGASSTRYTCPMHPVAAGILNPAFGLLLSPIFAGTAMVLSSMFVVTNAVRLTRVKL